MAEKLSPKDYSRLDGRVGIKITKQPKETKNKGKTTKKSK